MQAHVWGAGSSLELFPLARSKLYTCLKKKTTPQFLLSPAPDHHHSTFCLSDFGFSLILASVNISYKWNPKVFIFLSLAYFSQQNVLKVHLCCGVSLNFLPSFLRLNNIPWHVCMCIHFASPVHPLMDWRPSNRGLCHPFSLLPSIFPSIRVFSNESALHVRWPEY